MSILNGLGAGLTSFGADLGKDAEAEDARRASLINAAPPAVAVAATPVAATPNPLAGPRVPPVTDTDTHGNKLDPATLARAHDVYLGLTARGLDSNTALGFAANAVQESRADPGTGAGDMGASHGLLQWRGDRLAAYVAKFGHPPEKGDLNEQLDFVLHELGGSEAGAAKAIASAPADPAARAAAVSQFFERPKDTQAEIARRGYIANQLAGHFAQLATAGGTA